MPTKTKTVKVDTNDYKELLKDEFKTITLKLPKGIAQGSLAGLEKRIKDAAKEADPTYKNQPLEIGGEGSTYVQTRGRYYGGTYKWHTNVYYERPYTDEEIEKSGATIYKAILKRRAAAEKKRAANIRKLRKLQSDLGLEITNVEA